MRLSLIDLTTDPANKPPPDILNLIAVAGDQVARQCARAWGDDITTIMRELDGYPVTFVDDLPEAPGALGYHDNDPDIGPYSRIGVGTIRGAGGTWRTGPLSVSVVALHEVLEVACDPIANRWADKNPDLSYAQEVCDGVQEITLRVYAQARAGAPLAYVDVPDYVLPSYFNPYGKPPFDAAGKCRAAFSYEDGYAIRRQGNTVDAVFPAHTSEFMVAARTHVRSRFVERGGLPASPS